MDSTSYRTFTKRPITVSDTSPDPSDVAERLALTIRLTRLRLPPTPASPIALTAAAAMTNSTVPTLTEALELAPLKLEIVLPQRMARRLRSLAYQQNRSISQTTTMLLTAALVPCSGERQKLVKRDLEEVGIQQ